VAIDFPNNPSVNDTFLAGSKQYIWDGTTWSIVQSTNTLHAATHTSGGSDSVTLAQSQITGLTTDLGNKASSTDLSTHTSATQVHGATGAVVGTTNSQTLTNKTISGSNNTISNIAQSSVTNLTTELGSKVDYPSGGADGDALIKSGTAAAWSAPEAAGLTLIASESFSAVSSVSVNGCFTATYQNYKIVSVLAGTASVALSLRLRVGGADDSTANSYVVQDFFASGTSTGAARTTSNLWRVAGTETNLGMTVAYLSDPAAAVRTTVMSTSNRPISGAAVEFYFGSHNQSTAYDGFTLFPASGTITGVVRVYGLRN